MASHFGREVEGFMYTPKSPRFFKIVVEASIQDGKLEIPRSFVKKHGNGLQTVGVALLRVPNGALWKVELWKCNGRIWFRNGWPQFAKHYSLRHGHFLVFIYENSSSSGHFHVLIFDKSASEIEYPLPPCKKRMDKSPIHCPRPPKKLKSTFNSSTGGLEHVKRIPRGRSGYRGKCPELATILGFPMLIASQKARVVRIANSFKSGNPFFLAVIQDYNISGPFLMGIPIDFARKYLEVKYAAEATLCLLDGKTWSIKYDHTAYNGQTRSGFRTGWKKFALDNGLKVGDVCVFELLKGTKVSFKVVIQRATKDAIGNLSRQDSDQDNASIEILETVVRSKKTRERSSIRLYGTKARGVKLGKVEEATSSGCSNRGGCNGGSIPFKTNRGRVTNGLECPEQAEILRSPSLTPKAKAKALEIANAFKSENPFFLVVILQSYLEGRFRPGIPANFARNYLREKLPLTEATLCLPDGKTWCVKYHLSTQLKNSSGQFGHGMKKFAVDNNLKAGDVCVFELITAPKILLKVFIHRRAVRAANLYPSKQGNIKRLKLPYFKRIVCTSHLVKNCMDIPFGFSERYLKPNEVEEVTLEVAHRRWPAKLRRYPKYWQAKLGGGWTKFAKENSLKVGDVCKFELNALGDEDPTLKVSIFKCGG